MRWGNWIREDALARMERVGAFPREMFNSGLAARACFSFGSLHVHQREISDGAGPSEFGVLERGIVTCRGGQLRARHEDKNEVPQGRGHQGPAAQPPFYP